MTVEQDEAAVSLSYARLFADNPQNGDAETVLADILRSFGLLGPPNIREWMARVGSADGYETHLHERNGAFAVFEHIKSKMDLRRDQMVRLERLVRHGRAED